MKNNEDWDRQVADRIWMKLKGKHVPNEYDIEQCRDILKRYWHKAMESEQ